MRTSGLYYKQFARIYIFRNQNKLELSSLSFSIFDLLLLAMMMMLRLLLASAVAIAANIKQTTFRWNNKQPTIFITE